MVRLGNEEALREVWDVDRATELLSSLTSFGAWREFIREPGHSSGRWEDTMTDLAKTALLVEGHSDQS